MLPYPPRIQLAHLPTPLQRMNRLSGKLGVELWVKRDDMTGAELSGNKVRKLEFLIAEALARECDIILTCGGGQSNHCRATAFAARQRGMDSLLFLRVPDPANPPPLEGNILLDRLVGSEIRWITPEEYRKRAEIMKQAAEELIKQGRRPYVIPEGGSNAVGAWGYIKQMEELASQAPPGEITILYACGSGGTGAGLILGVKLFGLPYRVVGVNVCDNRDYFVKTISGILEGARERYHLSFDFHPSEIEIADGYVGRGYAQSRPEELALIRDVARAEGLVLDPVYTGKAFYGMTQELSRDSLRFGKRIVFLHTGGIFGLFPQASELAGII
jgi:D-cysteine desulfhydrase